MNIAQILDKIDDNQLFVPAFQREFVWRKDDVKDLMNSLIKEYPTGTLLTWETSNPPELKGDWQYTSAQGSVKLILDGQQRITSLYLLIRDKIPPYYTETEIKYDPRKLYAKVDENPVELQYYKPKVMSSNPCWVSITDIFQKKVRSRDIVRELRDKEMVIPDEMNDVIDDNFKKIENILSREFLEQTIPVKASLKEAIDIFYIVNSGGVNLTEAELALAQICGYWPKAREVFKNKLSELKANNFDFELDFVVYALLAIVHHIGSDMKKLHSEINKEAIEKAWNGLRDNSLDYLINLLKAYCNIESRREINHIYALIPMIVYVHKHNSRLSEKQINQMIRWFLFSQVRERYVSQLGTKLDRDIRIVLENEEPFVDLLSDLEPLKIRSDEFVCKNINNSLFNLMKMCFKSNNAVCMGTGVSIKSNLGKNYELDNDHIFPWSSLRDAGYDRANTYKYLLAQELTNRAILAAKENRFKKSDTSAYEYLTEVKKNFPNALRLQCIPDNPELWKLENYEVFLRARRELLSHDLNVFLNKFNYENKLAIDIGNIIRTGESQNIEFKSSLRWDYSLNEINKKLEQVIAKTVCGFLNSKGGMLLIGVDDKGEVLGLENDYMTLSRKDGDGFQQALVNVVSSYIGKDVYGLIDVSCINHEGRDLCLVNVLPSIKPVFVKLEGKEEFYVRISTTTQPLLPSQIQEYVNKRDN